MKKELEFPFDPQYLLKKRKAVKRELSADGSRRIKKKIAVLGGSTTDDLVLSAELFLLNFGIEPEFYQSEYNRFWEDAVFSSEELDRFSPDVVYIATSSCCIQYRSDPALSPEEAGKRISDEYSKYELMWEKLKRFNCPIIQNNFEQPYYALMGNMDSWDERGLGYFIMRLNLMFAGYAQKTDDFYILDLNRTAAEYGLSRWHDRSGWYLYKYMCAREAMPYAAYQLALIVKSIYGKNKKLLAADLDNTLWEGVVGDDGAENLGIGQETAAAQAYYDFQQYISDLKKLGAAITVCSKNDMENALSGLNHPEGCLKPEDFAVIKANWEPKDKNLIETLSELNLTPDALVFTDDNPAEREIVRQSLPEAAVPELDEAQDFITRISRPGYFEPVNVSADDQSRNEMYRQNIQRADLKSHFSDYGEYLKSLEMTAEISSFRPVYISRIAQLTNKSNQFNLTTRRFTPSEMEVFMTDENYIALYGKLSDRFGDNGVVSVVIGEKKGDSLEIILWLMSCRVLKRDMEFAMLDELVSFAERADIKRLEGVYIPTKKNGMVKNFYTETLGFRLIGSDENGVLRSVLDLDGYKNKNTVIRIERK